MGKKEKNPQAHRNLLILLFSKSVFKTKEAQTGDAGGMVRF